KSMQKVKVSLADRSYDVIIGSDILNQLGNFIIEAGLGKSIAVITNDVVAPLYLEAVKTSLKGSGLRVIEIIIPDGEKYKAFETAVDIYSQLLKAGIDRSHSIVALGGGVIGDIAGFVAATYLRGIPFIQVPTTLLAQVDASVGGKVGINLPQGKNMVGAFYQPKFVFIDVDVLFTLRKEVFVEGFSEVIKHGVIKSEKYFSLIENNVKKLLNLDKDLLIETVVGSVRIKADVVSNDERESSLRVILNYGHTIGHAIETLTGYTCFLHGEAVSLGMAAAGKAAVLKGLFSEKDLERQNNLLKSIGLPVNVRNVKGEEIIPLLQVDKKVKDGRVKFILPEKIGKVLITDDVKVGILKRSLSSIIS
ncbi:MAG: 3-dehydroquinate synthase, partial [Candidatus Auribacterota bacterium]|nr:3-dehydroquinate synthase [Candidatus Auribacterota bacterium]